MAHCYARYVVHPIDKTWNALNRVTIPLKDGSCPLLALRLPHPSSAHAPLRPLGREEDGCSSPGCSGVRSTPHSQNVKFTFNTFFCVE